MSTVPETPTKVFTPEMPPTLAETAPGALSTIDRTVEAELVLTKRSEAPLLEILSRLENAEALFERRAKLMESFYMTALKRTRPEDWILFKDRQENVNAMLAASGADLVAEVYGIRMFNVRPMDSRGMFSPERLDLKGGAYELRGACDAFSRVNGREIFGLEISRRNDEQFTGRTVDDDGKFSFEGKSANPADLRSAVLTGLRTKTVRVLCGMTRVPTSDLERAWAGSNKKIEQCRKGSGFGSGKERRGEDLSEADVKAEQKKLGDEVLRRVGGDIGAAKKLMKEVTAGPNFDGFDSASRLTKGWQIKNAWEKLKTHPAFGDREPGSDG